MIKRIFLLFVCIASLLMGGLPAVPALAHPTVWCCDCALWESEGADGCMNMENRCVWEYWPQYCLDLYNSCYQACDDELGVCWTAWCYDGCIPCDQGK